MINHYIDYKERLSKQDDKTTASVGLLRRCNHV